MQIERIGDAVLYCADCLEVLPTLGPVDAVVTDPPYGVDYVTGASFNRCGNTKHHGVKIVGDDKPFNPAPFLGFPVVVLFGAHNYASSLPESRGWIFWHKRPDMKRNDFGDGELIWTNQDHVIRYVRHMWNGVLRDSEVGDVHYHPTQKPAALMEWILQEHTQIGHTILDPFMGSGTTGMACARLGRRFIGIEIEERYFQIACERIKREYDQLKLFPPAEKRETVQLDLIEEAPRE